MEIPGRKLLGPNCRDIIGLIHKLISELSELFINHIKLLFLKKEFHDQWSVIALFLRTEKHMIWYQNSASLL